ncbi:MAG: hypothetical protein ACYC96_12325 [Fimbriimonadaceae bacterium]
MLLVALINFTSDKVRQGRFASSRGWTVTGYLAGTVITVLSLVVVVQRLKCIK